MLIVSKVRFISKMTSATICEQTRNDLKSIFLKSVQAVKPAGLIKNNVKLKENSLAIKHAVYVLNRPCYVVGFGKAVFEMAVTLESILDDYLQEGIVTVPTGSLRTPQISTKIRFIEGAKNNLPDEAAQRGALQIKKLVKKLEKDDLLIVLISGGGSALLPLPKHPITLREKLEITKNLSLRGANITELNVVRKNLSELKGGGLIELAHPAKVVSLILSDVIEDDLETIASGPTVPNWNNRKEAMEIIKKYSLYDTLPDSIRNILELDKQSETKVGEFRVNNFVVGNNTIATRAALEQATKLGYQSCVLSTKVKGDVEKISKIYAELACQVTSLIEVDDKSKREKLKFYLDNIKEFSVSGDSLEKLINFDFTKKICLILGGEPTVVVDGDGRGGRNQQLALQFSIEINKVAAVQKINLKRANISFLSCGTDGIDGPTDAAGALGSCNLVNNALEENMNPTQFVSNYDSYGFYKAFNYGNNLIRTGHTGTNVMDIHVLIIVPN